MDKKFYEGVVKSYDAQKKKHVVLYDDGDVEVLCLDKERWELIDNGHKPMKKSKPSKGSPHKELSSEEKNKFLSSSQQNKKSIDINSPSKIRGKRTPRKNLKHVQKGASKNKTTSELLEADSRGSPGISDPEHAEMHKHDDMNSGGEHIETTEKSLTDGEESDNDQKSASEGKLAEDAKNAPSDIEKSEQEEPNSEEKTIKPLVGTGGSNEDGSPDVEEKQPDDVLREGTREEGDKADQSKQTDSEETEADDHESNPIDQDRNDKKTLASSDSDEAEISDDEPLSLWKHRVGKPVQGK